MSDEELYVMTFTAEQMLMLGTALTAAIGSHRYENPIENMPEEHEEIVFNLAVQIAIELGDGRSEEEAEELVEHVIRRGREG